MQHVHNADMCVGEMMQFCNLYDEGDVLSRVEASEFDACGDMVLCMSQMNLSARVYHRILKLAPTIADLAGSEDIQSAHLTEALQYRPKLGTS